MHEEPKTPETEVSTPTPEQAVMTEAPPALPVEPPAPKKPRKPRKPRTPKPEALAAVPEPTPEEKPAPKPRKPKAAAKDEAKPKKPKHEEADEAEEGDRPFKMPKNYVDHDGRTITLCGSDVKLRVMTPPTRAKHGIIKVEGTMGKPCAEKVVLTFKRATQAEKFFETCLHADNDADEFIISGSKTDWYGDNLMGSFQ